MPRTSPRRPGPRLVRVLAALGLAVSVGAGAADGAAATPGAGGTRLTYRGVDVVVPAGWPVVDLGADPRACLRLDRPVVYLGNPGQEQQCRARGVGGRRAIWVALDEAGRGIVTGPGTSDVRTARDRAAAGPRTTTATAPPAPAAMSGGPVAASDPAPTDTSGPSAPRAATTAVSTRTFTGMGFDTCAAPSLSTMQAWQSSPYRVVGVYIGGLNRACGDGNLTATWVSTMAGRGWGVIPTYVGLQAPCVQMSGVSRIDPARAGTQGVEAAGDAITQARRFGLGSGSTVFLDIENYTPNATCTDAVLRFVSSWTVELRKAGFTSGVYGNPGSVMTDMARATASSRPSWWPPDQVWIAHWNGLQTTDEQQWYPSVPDSLWSGHRRVHQYRGDYQETWGGASLWIDANWVDATLPGAPAPVTYPTATTGPGGAGFVLTGDTRYWTPRPGSGLTGRAYTTLTTGATEGNGATWRPATAAATYDAAVYVPPGLASGVAVYTITSAASTVRVTRDHSTSGWVGLGRYTGTASRPVTIHLGDNSNQATDERIVADAARFTKVTVPSAPGTASAAPAPSAAVVSWSPAGQGGAAISGYTVRSTPGGVVATVSGSATSARLSGLTDGTAYTFTVTAANAYGSGPPSAPTSAVTPRAAAPNAGVQPVRIFDSRAGTTANPRRTAIAAGETVTIRVAGVSGSPIPAGATSAMVNLTVAQAAVAGYLRVVGPGNSSAVNFRPGLAVANSTYVPLAANGTVQLRNVSAGTLSLVVDAQSQVRTGAGPRWTGVVATRILDTRLGLSANPRSTPLRSGETLKVRVAGAGVVPAGATTLALNLTVTGPTAKGFLSVTGAGSTATSAVNFVAGSTIANLVTVRPASDGTVAIRNTSSGTVHVIGDVQGYAAGTSGQLWVPAMPTRLLDTRAGTTANGRSTALSAGESIDVRVGGRLGSPVVAGAGSAVLNLTVTSPTRAGYLVLGAGTTGTASAVNFAPGVTAANSSIARLASDGTVRLTNRSAGSVQVIVDAMGYTAP